MHRGVFRLCVRVRHTLMLYQGSPLSLITKDSSELWGEGQVNAWTQKYTSAHLTHKKKVLCLIWIAQKVNYLRELIDFMSMTVRYAKAVWVISTGVWKKQLQK